jgi:hypothetical protein
MSPSLFHLAFVKARQTERSAAFDRRIRADRRDPFAARTVR